MPHGEHNIVSLPIDGLASQEAFCFDVRLFYMPGMIGKLDHRQNTEIRNGKIRGPRKTIRAGKKEVRFRD